MSRFSKFIALAAAAVALAACGQKAVINGTLADAPSSEVIVKLLDVNKYKVLDTVEVNASGRFTYKADIKAGDPEFIFLFHGDRKIASLLLEAGDKVTVMTDTLGRSTVEGSEESIKLAQIEKDYAAMRGVFDSYAKQIEAASTEAMVSDLSKQMGKAYVEYYRDRVRYVMENSTSLTVVPVFYQVLGENLPLFYQNTDAILFLNAADSLETAYPDSRYVKALRAEAERRFGYLELIERLKNAEEIGYYDIELPDINAKNQKLSDLDSKVVLIYFWSASQPQQNLFNVEVLKPLYEDYHAKGFDIYQVSLDVDKALWATTVKGQELPWTNVCDARGNASPYIGLYNIPAIPAAFIISDGTLVDGEIVDEASLRKLLDKLTR